MCVTSYVTNLCGSVGITMVLGTALAVVVLSPRLGTVGIPVVAGVALAVAGGFLGGCLVVERYSRVTAATLTAWIC